MTKVFLSFEDLEFVLVHLSGIETETQYIPFTADAVFGEKEITISQRYGLTVDLLRANPDFMELQDL